MAEIKDRIISLRNEKNLTQSQLAEELNISPSAIGMYEQGRRKPSYELLEELCDYFNVDMDYLTGRSNIKNRFQEDLLKNKKEKNYEADLDKSDDDFKMVARDYNKLSEDKKKLFKSMMKNFMKSLKSLESLNEEE
jgi:transcriptional regulator